MSNKKAKKPVSQAQAGMYGAAAGGKSTKSGLSSKCAKDKLRGTKVKKLPKRK